MDATSRDAYLSGQSGRGMFVLLKRMSERKWMSSGESKARWDCELSMGVLKFWTGLEMSRACLQCLQCFSFVCGTRQFAP